MPTRVPGGDDPLEVRDAPAGGQIAPRGVGVADEPGHPRDERPLHVRCGRRAGQDARVRVAHVGEEVAEGGRKEAAAGDVRELPSGGLVDARALDLPDGRQRLGDRRRGLGDREEARVDALVPRVGGVVTALGDVAENVARPPPARARRSAPAQDRAAWRRPPGRRIASRSESVLALCSVIGESLSQRHSSSALSALRSDRGAAPRDTRARAEARRPARGSRCPRSPASRSGRSTFTSTYHDTADRALARAGITLRRRVENRRGPLAAQAPRRGRATRARGARRARGAPPPELGRPPRRAPARPRARAGGRPPHAARGHPRARERQRRRRRDRRQRGRSSTGGGSASASSSSRSRRSTGGADALPGARTRARSGRSRRRATGGRRRSAAMGFFPADAGAAAAGGARPRSTCGR